MLNGTELVQITNISATGNPAATSTQVTTKDIVNVTPGNGAVNLRTSDYTLALTDNNGIVGLNSGSSISATIPPNSAVPFSIYSQINVMQYGTGVSSIVAGNGVTIRYLSTLNLSAQYAICTLIKIGTNEWKAVGEFS